MTALDTLYQQELVSLGRLREHLGDSIELPADREHPPLFPDLSALLAPPAASVVEEEQSLPWNVNGEADFLPSEMFGIIFRFVRKLEGVHALGRVRCVCKKWQAWAEEQQTVKNHTKAVEVLLDADRIEELGRLLPFYENLIGSSIALGSAVPTPNFSRHETRSITLKKKGDEASFEFSVTCRDYDGKLSPLVVVLECYLEHPSWFRRLTLTQTNKTPTTTTTLSYVLSWKVDRRAILKTLQQQCAAPVSGLAPVNDLQYMAALLLETSPTPDKSLIFTGALAHTSSNRAALANWFDVPRMPLESIDPLLRTTVFADKLHAYQLRAVTWLKRTEDKIVHHRALAENAFFVRHPNVNGTELSVNLLQLAAPRRRLSALDCAPLVTREQREALEKDPLRPSFKVSSRGVLIGDAMGMGKTRTLLTFLLDDSQELSDIPDLLEIGDPAATTGHALPRDILLRTHALDFGANTELFIKKLPLGLFCTRASLVIIPNTCVSTWQREAKALFPHRHIIYLTSKSDHERLTYIDVATADLVIVTRQFLERGTYYAALRPTGKSVTNRAMFFSDFTDVLLTNLDTVQRGYATRKAPLLAHFAWERLVVEECHEVFTGTYHQDLGIDFLSARMVIGMSASLKEAFASPVFNETVMGPWLNLGFVVSKFASLVDKGLPVEHSSAGTMHGSAHANAECTRVPFSSISHLLTQSLGTNQSRYGFCLAATNARRVLYDKMLYMALSAVIWRNTLTNAATEVQSQAYDELDIAVDLHPLQHFYRSITIDRQRSWPQTDYTVLGLQHAVDLPVVSLWRPAVKAHATQALRMQSDIPHMILGAANAVCSFFATVNGRINNLEQNILRYQAMPPETVTNRTRKTLVELRQTVGDLKAARELSDTVPAQLEALLPRLESYQFEDEMERLYGTKVSAMCRYMDTIFAQQPKAQIVIGTCYAKAMEQVLDDVLVKRRGKRYAVLGGKNLPASLKQEELFKSGTVPVLLLNLHQAASGLNLQNADFVFLLDERIPAEMYNQMVARVQRQGKPNKAKVLRFRDKTLLVPRVATE